MARAWIYQDPKQVKKHGAEKASWYVGWIDPDGKQRCQSCGPFGRGKDLAEKLKKKREAELLTGTYQSNDKKTWEEFRKEYREKVLAVKGQRNNDESEHALDQFERLIKPVRMLAIRTQTIDTFISARKKEKGLKPESVISPATVNKELRHLRAAVKKAIAWNYVKGPVQFAFLKEHGKLPTYVPPEDFAKIYAACKDAELPTGLTFQAAEWWQGVLVFAYMTGWRIGSILSLRREHVDLEAGTAISLAKDNKGKRDQKIFLHPLVVEHLRRAMSFDPCFFPWNHCRRSLWEEFARIQKAADVHATGEKGHYSFHDLRRAFATLNADRLTPDALQALMQHKDYKTTQRYINMGRQMNPAVQNLFVPELKTKAGG